MVSLSFLAPFGYYGGDIGTFLLRLEQLGFFAYLLPFLIIFALVFGILTRMKIFEDNRAINAVIALSVGLMALQFGFVSNFFSEIFPRLGIALSILLAAIVLLGLFIDPEQRWQTTVLLGGSLFALFYVLYSSANFSGTALGYWVRDWGGLILLLIIVGVLIGAVVGSTKPRQTGSGQSIIERALRGQT